MAALRHELPEPALEPFLIAIGAPEAVVARATIDVEGHMRADSKAPVAAVAVAVLGALAVGQQASAAAQPNPWKYGNPVESGSQPNPMGSGSLQPNPLRSGSLQPNPLRSGSLQPNPLRSGSLQPNPMGSGSLQPNPLRSASLKPTLRWGKAEWQALRQTYRIK